MSKNKAYYEDLFVKHLLEVGVENWCETYERGNYYYCFWLKNGEQRYWTNMSEEHLEEIKENIMENNLKKQDQQIDQLKQQLAEKEKKIEFIKHLGNHKTTTEMFKENAKLIIEKRQLAIQELEKVKTLIQNAINFEKPNFVGVYDAINKQIKELKGEKDDG